MYKLVSTCIIMYIKGAYTHFYIIIYIIIHNYAIYNLQFMVDRASLGCKFKIMETLI